jgi:hypothetical protein
LPKPSSNGPHQTVEPQLLKDITSSQNVSKRKSARDSGYFSKSSVTMTNMLKHQSSVFSMSSPKQIEPILTSKKQSLKELLLKPSAATMRESVQQMTANETAL